MDKSNQFKSGDKVLIDSFIRGTVEGTVIGYDESQNFYMVDINGEILPVDHIVGNMRIDNDQ
jgi:hypothetical protein